MKLIAGLGNPGREYEGTRHNVGFEVIETLARRHSIAVSRRNFQAVFGEGTIENTRVLLVRPLTYMNLSGQAVAAILRYYRVPAEESVVILDDVALPLGRLRLRSAGSAGGHNGLANILALLHTQSVPRIRIGVGAARPGGLVGHVLSRFAEDERAVMQEAYALAADAVEAVLKDGFERAMNRFNVDPARPVSLEKHAPP